MTSERSEDAPDEGCALELKKPLSRSELEARRRRLSECGENGNLEGGISDSWMKWADDESKSRYKKLLNGLRLVYGGKSTNYYECALEARTEILGAYGLTCRRKGVKLLEMAEEEQMMARKCLEGRGYSMGKWLELNQQIAKGDGCDLRHVLMIEVGLLNDDVSKLVDGMGHRYSPPWFRGNWINMAKVIIDLCHMQIEEVPSGGERSASSLVQVHPIEWLHDSEGRPISHRLSTGLRAYSAGRVTDPYLNDDLIVRKDDGNVDEPHTTSDWMPSEIKLIATTIDFMEKADDETKEGWIALPCGPGEMMDEMEHRKWKGGLPPSLWLSLEGPPEPYGALRNKRLEGVRR